MNCRMEPVQHGRSLGEGLLSLLLDPPLSEPCRVQGSDSCGGFPQKLT